MTEVVTPTMAYEGSPATAEARSTGLVGEAELASAYDAHRGEVLAFLIGMTRDVEVAEDLLQDAFLRLIRESRAGRMPDDVRPWLFRVAANAAIDRGRRGSRLVRLLPRLLDRREPDRPEAQVLRSEREAEIHAALSRLSPDRRAALLLAARGFSGAEIAASLGRSELATRSLLCRARVELRGVIEAGEVRP
jgi:RNA polymerase sigma-70 factor (ECF subfamily)